MRTYKNIYWLLDQRFDFLLPLFEKHYGIDRKQITFVGSYHGSARKGEEWENVTKVLIGKNKLDGSLYVIDDDEDKNQYHGNAAWLEPEDINRAYADSIEASSDTLVVAFSGAYLPEGIDSFTAVSDIAIKLNDKWEQWRLFKNKRILTPKTTLINLNTYCNEKKKEELQRFIKNELTEKNYSENRKVSKQRKIVVKKENLSGGYHMKLISDDNDIKDYCESLEDEELLGCFLASEYIPHKHSYAGMGIVSRKEKGKSRPMVTYCGMTEQVLYREFAYEGLIWPPYWDVSTKKTIEERKNKIQEITVEVGKVLSKKGYYGYYNVDFVEESGTGKIYAVEVNARFGFGTILYALYCGDCFFDAIQGKEPPVLKEENATGKRILLGKVKGFEGKQYTGLCNLSDIKSWYKNKDFESFRTYYLGDEPFGYGSFAGLFGEKISNSVDRETALAKFMNTCLLREKKLYFLYVDSYCGLEKQFFNYDLIRRYEIAETTGKEPQYNITQKTSVENDLSGFWRISNTPAEDRNITALSILVGENGSGKTTLMRLIIKWISLLAIGCFPEEKGALVFGRGDGQNVLIAFSGGEAEEADAYNIEGSGLEYVSDLKEIKRIFGDVGLLYYTDTMSDLSMDRLLSHEHYSQVMQDLFTDTSERHEQEILLSQTSGGIYGVNRMRNKEMCDVLSVWRTLGLGSLPETYVRISVSNLSKLDEMIQKGIGKIEGTESFVPDIKDLANKIQRDNPIEWVLLWVLLGIINNILYGTSNNLRRELCNRIGNAQSAILEAFNREGKELWTELFWIELLSDIAGIRSDITQNDRLNEKDPWADIVRRVFNVSYLIKVGKQNYVTANINADDEWIYSLNVSGLKEDTCIKTWIDFMELCEKIPGLLSNQVTISPCFQSSGERNRVGLLASLSKCIEKGKKNVLCCLDEPDNSFHPEWKRLLVKELIEICGRFPNWIQVFLSSHSPIILSDAPGNSTILFKLMKSDSDSLNDDASRIKIVRSPGHSPFGQQIYTLYKDSFFMERSVIGSFAVDAIQAISFEMWEIENYLNANFKWKHEELNVLEQRLNSCKPIIKMVEETLVGGALRVKLSECQMKIAKAKRISVTDSSR